MKLKLLIYVCTCALFYTDDINAANRGIRGSTIQLTPEQRRRVEEVHQSDPTLTSLQDIEQQQSSGKHSHVSSELLQQMKANETLKQQISEKEKIEDLLDITPPFSTSVLSSTPDTSMSTSSSSTSSSSSSTSASTSAPQTPFKPRVAKEIGHIKQLKAQKDLSKIDEDDNGFEILDRNLRREISDLHKIQEANELSAISEESLQHLQPAIRKEITKRAMIADPKRLPDNLFSTIKFYKNQKKEEKDDHISVKPGLGANLKIILEAKDMNDPRATTALLAIENINLDQTPLARRNFGGGILLFTLKKKIDIKNIDSVKSRMCPLLGEIALTPIGNGRTLKYLILLKNMIHYLKGSKKDFSEADPNTFFLIQDVIKMMLNDATYEQLDIR